MTAASVVPDPVRLDRLFAFVAFLLTLTALLLPWWSVTWDDGATRVREPVSAFRPDTPLTTAWGPWLTGLLAAGAALLLFVRLAANSHLHEPASWRRDLGIAAALLALAAASCLLWPVGVPSFWGGRTYVGNVTDGRPVHETTTPMLGWWLAVVSAGLAFVAWLRAGKTAPLVEGAPGAEGTIQK